MDFFTKVDTPAASFNIDYTSHLAFFGSCFTDKISAQFAARKFDVFANPFGTVYNPASIERQIKAIAEGKVFGEGDVFQDTRSDKLWHSWDAHGSLSGATCEECITKMNEAATRTREFLQKADVVFITLGTALVYFLKDAPSGSGNIRGCAVSNCHRQDPRIFEHRMITVEEAAESIRGIVVSLRTIAGRNPHIVLTVSPLRHTGDGAHGNTLSKATLQLAVEKAIAGMQASANSVSYFPSYEIVMDELRDYRFYADDMIHLSKAAEEYIFERMAETYCSERTRADIARVEKFMKMANHRIMNADSDIATEFAKKRMAQARELEIQIPGLDLGQDIQTRH